MNAPVVEAGDVFTTAYKPAEPRDQAIVNAIDNIGSKLEWMSFQTDDQGLGDAAISPFGNAVEYKLNAINYNLYFSETNAFPFQLFYADIAATDNPSAANKTKLLDSTQGVALRFPVAWRYTGNEYLCKFKNKKGYCVGGGDITLRGVPLNEKDSSGQVKQSWTFGGSASLRGSMLFPIFTKVPGSTQAGHLSLGLGARYYYQNTENQDLLFGKISDPNGKSVTFSKSFSALNVESEFDIYKHFKIRLEYFRPFSNRAVLVDVFKASLVVAPSAP